MPYIPAYERPKLDAAIETIEPTNAGELNYVITQVILEYLTFKGNGYNWMNELMGVLLCVALEFYRRVVAPYEDIKAKQNGDVY